VVHGEVDPLGEVHKRQGVPRLGRLGSGLRHRGVEVRQLLPISGFRRNLNKPVTGETEIAALHPSRTMSCRLKYLRALDGLRAAHRMDLPALSRTQRISVIVNSQQRGRHLAVLDGFRDPVEEPGLERLRRMQHARLPDGGRHRPRVRTVPARRPPPLTPRCPHSTGRDAPARTRA